MNSNTELLRNYVEQNKYKAQYIIDMFDTYTYVHTHTYTYVHTHTCTCPMDREGEGDTPVPHDSRGD